MHITKGKPSSDATKIWLTKAGGCVLASNGSRIPTKDLNELLEIIAAQYFMICSQWKEHFLQDNVKFYC